MPQNKPLMVLNSLTDFCFDGGEYKYITVNNYEAHWVKNIKDNVICLNKQQIKDAVAYLFRNCHFTVGPMLLFLYFYKSKWMNKLKKNNLIKARKLCNIFRLINDLNSINDGGDF